MAGDGQADFRSGASCVVKAHASAMRTHDLLNQMKPQDVQRIVFTRSFTRSKPAEHRFRVPGAMILYAQQKLAFLHSGRDADRAARGRSAPP